MNGGPMPYVMDVGPYLSVLENQLNTPAKRAQILARLRNRDLLSSIVGLDSTNLYQDGKQPDERVKILNECWFGMTRNAAGGWDPQPLAFPTGFWNGYQGDPQEILRAGLIRAIEVSLGINHGAQWSGSTPSANGGFRRRIDTALEKLLGNRFGKRLRGLFNGTRDWPIEISWVCQGPFFQCWVTWMQGSGNDGHVALTITTPAAKGLPLDPKITRAATKPEYACPPPNNAHTARRGVWVIGHEDYDVKTTFSTIPSKEGVILIPAQEYRRKSTDVVCVAPAEWEAGVLAGGRPYTP
jgi:hypothetical protein